MSYQGEESSWRPRSVWDSDEGRWLSRPAVVVDPRAVDRPARPASADALPGASGGLREVGREGFYARLARGFALLRDR